MEIYLDVCVEILLVDNHLIGRVEAITEHGLSITLFECHLDWEILPHVNH